MSSSTTLMTRDNVAAVPGTLVARADADGRRAGWLIPAALVAAGLWLHLPITDVCDGLVRKFGFVAYDAFLRRAFFGLGLATVVAAAAFGRSPARRRSVAAIGVLFGAAIVVQHVMLVASIENVHYPQFALLALALLRCGMSLETAWASTTAMGAVDELYQYLELPRGTPSYFDWNDVVLNAMGAAFGIA